MRNKEAHINLNKYEWRVVLFIVHNCEENETILECIRDLNCFGLDYEDIQHHLSDCGLNTGLTYSNLSMRSSVMVIGRAENAEQFDNTLRHEQHHLVCHICESDNIELDTETSAYIAGEIAMQMHYYVSEELCNCCRNE